MSADTFSLTDDFTYARSLDSFVEKVMFRDAGSITSPEARRDVLEGLEKVRPSLELWRNSGVHQSFELAKAFGITRDALFSLEPRDLSQDEAAELDAFRARPSRVQGVTFQKVPNRE